MGDAHVNADHRRILGGLDRGILLVGEGEPPAIRPAPQGDTAIEHLSRQRLAMIGNELNWQQHRMPLSQSTQAQPVVKAAVLRGLQQGDIRVRLNDGLFEDRGAPSVPDRRFAFRFLLPLLLRGQQLHIVVISGRVIGAPGVGDAGRMLNHHPLPPL